MTFAAAAASAYGPGGHKPATTGFEAPSLRLADQAMQSEAADRRVFPRHDDVFRRNAEGGDGDVTRRRTQLGRDDRADAGDEGFGSRAEQPRARDVKLADAALDEFPLHRAGADDGCFGRKVPEAFQQGQPGVALPLRRRRPDRR